jgi:hypothetical protein
MKTMMTKPGKPPRSEGQTCLCAVAIYFGLAVCGLTQPSITRQPTNLLVSVGVTAQFRVTATATSPPLTYQWSHNQKALEGATDSILILTNVQTSLAGAYAVVVSDAGGSVTSQPALLDVDPAFTKIVNGVLVTDLGKWYGAAWADYDNDGDPDMFIHRAAPAVGDLIYRNNGDGTFARLTSPIPQGLAGQNGAWGVAWGDWDNDGHLDLFIANGEARNRNALLRNRGDGTFQSIASGPGAEGRLSGSGAWGDYDRDGWLDLFVANGGIAFQSATNFFYRNLQDGTFSKLTTNQVGIWLKEIAPWTLVSWVDYNDDGWLDLMVPDPPNPKVRLYRNLGNGSFTSVTYNAIVAENISGLLWYSYAWGDYDNDGRLDLFAALDGTRPNRLYHNESDGIFKKMSAIEVGSLVNDRGFAGGVAWGDYDNDGFLDLFVASGWWSASGAARGKNFLYHNNGDGTFDRVKTGSPANELGEFMTAHWVDYDRDGFLDLFIGQHGSLSSAPNHLYRNNGNANAWLVVTCVGTSSPRFGMGAKVRARATIGGKDIWQLRLIGAGGTTVGGQSFEAHFGLGDATVVDTLRIEWPSGIVQEFHDLPAKQYLTVTEPTILQMKGPSQFTIRSWKSMAFSVEASTDLLTWTPFATATNVTGTLEFADPDTASQAYRFYRAMQK